MRRLVFVIGTMLRVDNAVDAIEARRAAVRTTEQSSQRATEPSRARGARVA